MNKKKLISEMKKCVQGPIPSGIDDENIEFFAKGELVYAIMNQEIIPSYEWPEWLFEIIEKDMEANPAAVESLVTLGLDGRREMIDQYIRCRYGSLDNDPDLVAGVMQDTEYVSCHLRGSCPFEGKLCELFKAPYGTITQREIQVLRLIPEGLLDKEIADQLGISPLTVEVYMKSLRAKTGCKNKAELVRFAFNHNLL
jgi:DNA-binding CsgD family transcriptional regulator